MDLSENAVVGCSEQGLYVEVHLIGRITRNIVWGCGRDGMVVWADFPAAIVSNNTFAFNGGSGIVSRYVPLSPDDSYEIVGNIGYRNARYGLEWATPYATSVRCNDWFGNGLGEVGGLPMSPADFTMEPGFCGPDSGDFHLRTGSPLLEWAGCGLVGALGAGCGVTSAVVRRFTAERVEGGVRVVWEVSEEVAGSEVWLERAADGDGAEWTRPVTERSREGAAVVELDRGAESERSYRYRLMAWEGGSAVILGPPVLVGSAPAKRSRLERIAPDPASGHVRIAFSLEQAASIDLEIFDVQGRVVASVARGPWPSGEHVVDWNGAAESAGWYLARYRYPGGQDVRPFVRTR